MSLHDGEHPSAIFLLDLEDSLAHLGQFVDDGLVGLQLLLQTVILTCNYLPFLRVVCEQLRLEVIDTPIDELG